MSDVIPIQVADAVATQINAGVTAEEFSTLGFTATRRYYDWDRDYKGLGDLTVETVFRVAQPEGSIALDSAGTLEYETAVDVVVLKRFGTSDRTDGRLKNSSVDPLVTLVGEIHEYLSSRRNDEPLATMPSARWIRSDVLSWVSQQRLREGLFEGVVRVMLEVSKGN